MSRPRPFESALVTGASSGLGRAFALELARRGCHVHLAARRRAPLEELAAELNALGPGGTVWELDVTDSDSLRSTIHGADEASGGLDLVIANAGVAENGLEITVPAASARRVFEVNTIGAVETLEMARAVMGPRGQGHLAAISSLAGVRGFPGPPAYCASKSALSVYVESMRFELRGTGLTITDVKPGFVRTAMTARNAFKMPFLMEVETAARRTIDGLERRAILIRYPRRLAWPLGAFASLSPGWLWRAVLGLPSR